MITGTLSNKSGAFFDQLEAQGKDLAQRRAKVVATALRSAEHRWRLAAALWPDLGLE